MSALFGILIIDCQSRKVLISSTLRLLFYKWGSRSPEGWKSCSEFCGFWGIRTIFIYCDYHSKVTKTGWLKTEIYHLTVLGTRSPKWRCHREGAFWGLWRTICSIFHSWFPVAAENSLAYRELSPVSLHSLPSVCACVQISPLYIETSHIGLWLTLMTSSKLHYLFSSKVTFWGTRAENWTDLFGRTDFNPYHGLWENFPQDLSRIQVSQFHTSSLFYLQDSFYYWHVQHIMLSTDNKLYLQSQIWILLPPPPTNCYFAKASKGKTSSRLVTKCSPMYFNFLPHDFCNRPALISKMSTGQRRRLNGNMSGGRIKSILPFCPRPPLLCILACLEEETHAWNLLWWEKTSRALDFRQASVSFCHPNYTPRGWLIKKGRRQWGLGPSFS